MKSAFIIALALLSLTSCQKETKNSNVEKLLFDQYKESELFYENNLNDYQQFISSYISQNPKKGLFPSYDSISRIKNIVNRTVSEIDSISVSEKAKMVLDRRNEIEKLSKYKYDFIELKSLEGLNDSLYNQAIKTDLLKANYNIYMQYYHDKMTH